MRYRRLALLQPLVGLLERGGALLDATFEHLVGGADVVDIDRGADVADPAAAPHQRGVGQLVPAIGAVMPAQADLQDVGFVDRGGRPTRRFQDRAVLGMEQVGAPGIVQAGMTADVIGEGLVEILGLAAGEDREGTVRQGVEKQLEAFLARFYAVADQGAVPAHGPDLSTKCWI